MWYVKAYFKAMFSRAVWTSAPMWFLLGLSVLGILNAEDKVTQAIWTVGILVVGLSVGIFAILCWFGFEVRHEKMKMVVRKCKNCGRLLRGLRNAPEIPVHQDTESRFCDSKNATDVLFDKPTRFAEWK